MHNTATLVRFAQVSLALSVFVLASFGQAVDENSPAKAPIGKTKSHTAVPSGIPATNRFVTKVDDTFDGVCDADCSLRDAIHVAASGDFITFSALFNNPQTIMLTASLVVSSKSITLFGPGAKLLTIDGSGAGTEPVFRFLSSPSQIIGVTIRGGNSTVPFGVGGGIYVSSAGIILDGVHVTGNGSTFSGGGIYIESAVGTQIMNSTISANTSGRCGGVMLFSSSATITNSTVSGNTSAGNGGGLCAESGSTLNVHNSTVVNNSAFYGGGIFIQSGNTLSFRSSIVALNNDSSGRPDLGVDGSATSGGFNLVGNSFVPGLAYQSTDILDTDPSLGSLTDSSSPTPVHFPTVVPVSPVIDKGFSFGQMLDQRRMNRVYDNPSIANATGGDGTDIGAVERQAPTAASISVGGRVLDRNGRSVRGVRITLQRMDNGQTWTAVTGAFGYYRFDDLAVGQSYFISASAKRLTFDPPTRLLTPGDSAADVDFTAIR